MKKIVTLVAVLTMIGFTALAQVPQSIPYQAVARNTAGNLIANQNVSLRFSIHDATAGGTVIYQETQNTTTNSLGLFSVNIGAGTMNINYGAFSAINWGMNSKFTQVEIDPTGGNNYIDMGTQQMMSVPFSFYAGISSGAPRMTQAQINALTPVEGMTVFNTDAHKVQVYAMLTDNAEIDNQIYTGTTTDVFGYPFLDQSFTPPISGQVVSISVLAENTFGIPSTIFVNGIAINIPANSSFTWYTASLTSPMAVSAGVPAGFFVENFDFAQFATNSFYPNGSGCCFFGADDLLFIILIQPTPGSFGWQNLN